MCQLSGLKALVVLQFGELLSNVNVLRITKENLQKKHVQVISVTDDELVRVGNCNNQCLAGSCSPEARVLSRCCCDFSMLVQTTLSRRYGPSNYVGAFVNSLTAGQLAGFLSNLYVRQLAGKEGHLSRNVW